MIKNLIKLDKFLFLGINCKKFIAIKGVWTLMVSYTLFPYLSAAEKFEGGVQKCMRQAILLSRR